MSTVECKIEKIKILPHDNADSLELAEIGGEGGFICVVKMGEFKTGDLAIYIPVDSVVSGPVLEFLEQSKITIKNGRIRCAKIRGVFSEGLCLKPEQWLPEKEIKEGNDVTKLLGITKYEPPPVGQGNILRSVKGVNIHYKNERFVEYTCVEKFKKYPKILQDGEEVVVTIKMHGTNWRAGWVEKPLVKKTFWQKLKEALPFFTTEDVEFLVGSHATIRKPGEGALKDQEYAKDTYWRAAIKYNIKSITQQIAENELLTNLTLKTLPDVVIYAEIIGPGVQVGYDYSVAEGDIEIRVFDIMINKKFQDWDTVVHLCNCFNLPTVTEVYRGPWSKELTKYAEAVDEYNGKKFVREGVVIRPLKERRDPHCGRVMLKYLNPAYELDKKNSEYH